MDLKIQLVLKRFIDIVLSLIGLLMLSVPFVLISLVIKLSSKGPVIFRQPRAGKGGNPFTLYKFRTMVVGAADGFVQNNDPRVTRVGRLLRMVSLDEIPQLWNIIRGDMSLVGPRPDRVFRAEQYDERIRRRLSVLPGIMGWAQLHNGRSLSWEERYELDLEYVDNWSLWLDLKIIVFSLLRGNMVQREGEKKSGKSG